MDARPRDVPGPLAVFRGRAWFGCVADPCLMFLIALFGIVVTTGFARFLPWPSALEGGPGLEGLALLLGLAGFATLVAIQRWAVARIGRAELFADRIVVKHRDRLVTIRLAEVDAFEDGAGDYVRLVLTGEAGTKGDVTVPTPSETGRAALIEALAAAGVPRLDGQPLGERARGIPGPTLLTVTNSPVVVGVAAVLSLVVLSLVAASARRLELHEWTILISLLLALPVLAAVWANPRTGVARFHEDQIVIGLFPTTSSNAWRLTLAWGDVVGWRPSSRAYLRLVLRPGLLRDTQGEPTIPTPTPELRAAVEALLTARGVPRL